ncbi:hypothetical protein EYF80_027916 [Liparis tanakae]|uniref:Uncharacterized protein n=1 Tax=Liparis tanakae TaxID=230148 RepID=A0A4Z2H8P8_9TELE|nr:hypothetical protein EYF80_027916 [Liparis tanakae]
MLLQLLLPPKNTDCLDDSSEEKSGRFHPPAGRGLKIVQDSSVLRAARCERDEGETVYVSLGDTRAGKKKHQPNTIHRAVCRGTAAPRHEGLSGMNVSPTSPSAGHLVAARTHQLFGAACSSAVLERGRGDTRSHISHERHM